jgi:serine/threonine protein kinase
MVVPSLCAAGRDLLSAMLAFDPARRISAAEALAHPYFAGLRPPPPAPAAAGSPQANAAAAAATPASSPSAASSASAASDDVMAEL